MVLPVGVIIAVVIVGIIAILLLAGLIYYFSRKNKQDDSCTKLISKYMSIKHKAGQRTEMIAEYPDASPTFVKTPVPGQQFTSGELEGVDDSGFTIPIREGEAGLKHSMYKPIDPESIDPRIYSTGYEPEGAQAVTGKRPAQVIFNVEYDQELSILKICVLEARHLRSSSAIGVGDPYCTVSVKPGHAEKQSKVVKRTADPNFNENFRFDVSKSDLKEKSIEIKFFEFDQYSRHELTGTVQQRLNELDLKEGKIDLWRKITLARPDNAEKPEEYGDILLRLGYLPSAEKLTVVLLKARNLKPLDEPSETKPPDPYIRVAILHDGNLLKKKKTSTKRKTVNPTYNQAINFGVPLHVLPQVEIQFHIVHDSGVKIQRTSRKETIGYLEIGPHSSGDEYDHWVDLMSNKPQARWHRLKKGVQEPEEGPMTTSDSTDKQSTSAR